MRSLESEDDLQAGWRLEEFCKRVGGIGPRGDRVRRLGIDVFE